MQFFRAVIVLGVLGTFLWVCAGCSKNSDSSRQQGQVHNERHAHDEQERHENRHNNHAHGEESKDVRSTSLDEIARLKCEHNVLAYECPSCRYEVGVVKVPASLLKDDSKAEGGLIRTESVARAAVTDGLNVTGEVQLNENAAVHISPRIPGIIESVRVDIGAHVRKGDVLFTINSVELGKALSDYERSRALTELSEKNFKREKSLFNRRIASEQDMIEAQMVYEQHKTERKSAEQALHVLGLSEEDLVSVADGAHGASTGTLPIRAPIEGTIIEKHAVVGELVEPGSDVMLLADLATVWVWADIYEQDLPRLIEARKQGPIPARVLVTAFPEEPFPGRIDYIGATMEERTRTVKVRATVENMDGLLRPGMFCEIDMGISGSEEVLAIPRVALLSDEGQDFVFTHWKGDYYVRRPVKKGREFFEHVEILEGLDPKDTIVAAGAFLLKSDILREKMGAGCAD